MTDTMDVRMIRTIAIIADGDFNSRGKIAPIDVVELAEDIATNGLLQPIVIAPITESMPLKYKLIAGFRRYTAHLVLERKLIPASIRTDLSNDPVKAICLNLSENTQRANLNLLQEAKTLERLKELHVNEFEAAKMIGKSRGWVQVRFMLLNLPEAVQAEAGSGMITQTHVRELNTILRREGVDAVFAACKLIKETKERNLTRKPITVNPNQTRLNVKKHRTRAEIFKMMDHIAMNVPRGIHSRALAWCAGEITTEDFFIYLKQYADDNGHEYTIPTTFN